MAKLSDYTAPNNVLQGGKLVPVPIGAAYPTQNLPASAFQGPAGPQGPTPAIIDNGPGSALGDAQRNAASDGLRKQSLADLAAGMSYGAAQQPTAAPAVDYGAEYRNAMAQSQAGLTQQFNMAMGDIAQREGLANKAVGMVPGQLNTIYNTGDANMAQNAHTLDAAAKAGGVRSYIGAGAQMAPVKGAITANKASDLSSVPLIALAVQNQMAQERGALNQAHQGALADLAQQSASIGAQQSDAAANRAFQADQNQKQMDYDTQKSNSDFGRQVTLAQMANGAAGTELSKRVPGFTVADEQKVATSPQFLRAVTMINTGQVQDDDGKMHALTPAMLMGFASGNPKLIQLLTSYYPAFFAGK